jgi:hypothetical protein
VDCARSWVEHSVDDATNVVCPPGGSWHLGPDQGLSYFPSLQNRLRSTANVQAPTAETLQRTVLNDHESRDNQPSSSEAIESTLGAKEEDEAVKGERDRSTIKREDGTIKEEEGDLKIKIEPKDD